MGGRREGRCQEAGGEKVEECCKEQGQLAEASKEGLGSKWAVVPMMTMIIAQVIYLGNGLQPVRRRLFLKQMSHEVVIVEITRSIKSVGMPINLQKRLKIFCLCTDEEKEDESSPGPSKRRR
jgi:hypothetical protein